MITTTVIFEEPLHHVCLMHGLKHTFGRMPFLNKKVRMRMTRNMVDVSYWKNKLSIEYREDMCSQEDITAFVNNLIEDYLHFRHPFMKIAIKDGRCHEMSSGHLIAEII